MKFSTLLALSALVGRELVDGPRNWKDAALAAFIAKNEVADKDGAVRKLISNGVSDGEVNELNAVLEKEMEKQRIADQMKQESAIQEAEYDEPDDFEETLGFIKMERPKRGPWEQFRDGFMRSWRKR